MVRGEEVEADVWDGRAGVRWVAGELAGYYADVFEGLILFLGCGMVGLGLGLWRGIGIGIGV